MEISLMKEVLMNYEEQLLNELDDIVDTLENTAHAMRDLRTQIHINKRDIKNFKAKITKLEKELAVYKAYAENK